MAAGRRPGRAARTGERRDPASSIGCCGAAGTARGHGAGARPPGRDRPHRRSCGAAAALLGRGGQRTGPDRGRRGADQAVRAVLPVDLLGRHRGQEAHRPFLRAAHPGVRGGPARAHRRRRGQGGGDLPGPQGGAGGGGDRRRGRRFRAAGRRRHHRARDRPALWRSSCRPWSGTCSGTRRPCRSTPRPGPSGRPGRPSKRRWRRAADDCWTGCAPTWSGRGAVPHGPARRELQRQPRGRHRRPAGVAAALRDRGPPPGGLRVRDGQDRHARAPCRRPPRRPQRAASTS